MLRACRQEARALARIAIAAEARLPGKQTTTAVSIRATVLRGKKRGAEPDDERGHAVAQRTGTPGAEEGREGGARTRGEKRRQQQQDNSATEQADGTPQPKRQRTEVQTYDEMKRRGTRKRKVTYLVTDGQRAGAKKDSMAAGAATLDRTVGQRYEWRDSGLAEAKRRRGGLFGGARDGA